MHASDFSASLRRAILLAREAGLAASAAELEERSSREGRRVSTEVAGLLDQCLAEIGKVWPKHRP